MLEIRRGLKLSLSVDCRSHFPMPDTEMKDNVISEDVTCGQHAGLDLVIDLLTCIIPTNRQLKTSSR